MPQLGDIGRDRKSNQCIWLACEECGKERWVRLKNGQPQSKVCTSCRGRQLGLKYGEENPNWKGGEILTPQGYVYTHYPNHPYANRSYIPRARLILEEKLGRYLLEGCVPHHINGIRDDDKPENLVELTRSEHNKLHHSKKKGVIWFQLKF